MGDNWTDRNAAAQDAEQAAYDAQQQAWADENARQADIAWARLKAILRGERPTRESNDEWAARNMQPPQPQPGMLPIPPAPADDPYFYKKMRDQLQPNDPRQAALGPLEHQQFMQEVVQQNPLMAVPMATVGIPGYTLGKATGLIQGTRSPASIEEMLAAYRGLFNGLMR